MGQLFFHTYLDEIYFLYGIAFVVLGVVVHLLPRQDATLRFARHLWLLGVFALLHGVHELLEWENMRHAAQGGWRDSLCDALGLISYLPLLEFGRRCVRLPSAAAAAPCSGDRALPALWVWGGAAAGALLLALAGADTWAGIKTGIRYFVGAPGALLAGLGLIAQARQRRSVPGDASLAAFLLIGALAFIGYGLLTLVLGRADPQLPQWLPLQADFAAVFGFPVQLARALLAVAIAFALTKVVRIANAQMQGRLATALEQAARSNAELERRVAERTQAADAVNLQLRVEVAERRQAEEALRRLNEELEQRVSERTAKLEAANQELETFTYSVSHDLKAPLRGIDGYSQLLLEGHSDRLDEEGRRFLQNVRQAAQHMGQLINDLLAYARLEKGGVRAGQLDPRELVDVLLAERAGEITARGVAVSVAVPGTAVSADRDALAMALRNLLENALKFSRDAAPAQIEIAGQAAGGAYVLSVRDNGTGFDMKYHDRIFAIFQRLHRSEEYPGTGIGLAIVKKAMQRMGGRVWAESAPHRGATFYLEIPQ